MLTELDRLELKGVTRMSVTVAGGQENATNVSGRIERAATFSDYCNPARKEIVALDVAIELDQFNGKPMLIGKAAGMLGCDLVKRPRVMPAPGDMAGLCKMAKESSEAIAAVSEAFGDGRITPAERQHVRAQLDEAVVAYLEIRALLDLQDGEGEQ